MGGKVNRKWGRSNRKPCGGTNQRNRSDRNKIRKNERHCISHPNDKTSWEWLLANARSSYLALKQSFAAAIIDSRGN